MTGRRLRPKVTAVTIRGAHAISPHVIQNSIKTTASHCRGLLLAPLCLVSKSPYLYERDFLDRDELKRDVLRIRVLYWRAGYRLASVDTTVSPPGGITARVGFTIHEGPATRVTAVRVEPDTLFIPRVLQRLVTLRVGDPLDLEKLDTTVSELRSHLWAKGFSDATVDTNVRVAGQPPADSATLVKAAAGRLSAGTAEVTLRVTPRARTVVDTVVVGGNEHVSSQTVRHVIPLRSNSLFLRTDIPRSQRALFETGLFRNAAITVDTTPGKPDSVKTVFVNVSEAPSRQASIGAAFTTADFFSISGQLTDFNWVGGGRRLVITSGVGNLFAHGLYNSFNNGYKEIPPDISADPFLSPTWSVSADVTQPWFLAPENALTLGVFAHRRIAPGVYIDNAIGGNIIFDHNVADRAPISIGYRYEQSHVQAGDAYFCVDYGICDAATRAALETRGRISPIILGARIDRSNDPVNPSAGYLARFEFQHASQYTLSDFRYNRAYAYASAYRPVSRFVLAFNARAGYVQPLPGSPSGVGDTLGRVLNPTVRFYAGGAQSVRGFGENQLGPQILTVAPNVLRGSGPHACPATTPIQNCPVNGVPYLTDANFLPQPLGGRTLLEGSAEFRFPILGPLGGAIFVDGAVVGLADLAHATSGSSAITPGFGIRYNSIVGPIRVDIGFNPLTTYHLVVLTEDPVTRNILVVTGPAGTPPSAALRTYAPARTLHGLQGIENRFALHLSIGQAF